MKRTFEEAEKTKVSILNSGTRIFARVGYERATLQSIGNDANLTRGAIYWHFKNKQELFERILEREAGRLDKIIKSALSTNAPPFSKLRRLLEAVIDNFFDNETFRDFIELTWYKLGSGQFGRIMNSKTAFVQNFLSLIKGLLEKSLASGEIRPGIDVRRASYHLSCLINGFYRLYHVAPDWARDKTLTKLMFQSHLDSLARIESPTARG
jgi:AcrR family transcriptional regulator